MHPAGRGFDGFNWGHLIGVRFQLKSRSRLAKEPAMARLPRLTLAGYPHHVIQRGNNRQAIFADRQDFETMLALLAENAQKFRVAIHAYVLMDNHFHLLATPATAEALPRMMQAVGRSYVRYFNDRHGRSGTLWEGRYRSTLIETDRYLLACMAYIDLNPVRAGMVAQPLAWPWSSHAHYLGPAQRQAGHAACAVLGAGQHAVRARGRLRRTGAGRYQPAPSRPR
ncbi:transposase IS200 family protein [Alicycliphilus sp. B1]|nr:transposase IS200 family protein [Alicycliphilus sp. B1]